MQSDFDLEAQKRLLGPVLEYVVPFLQAAAILTVQKFESRRHVWLGGPVVAFRVGYVFGACDAALRLEAQTQHIKSLSEDSAQELATMAAVTAGWIAFGFQPTSEGDGEEFGQLFSSVREHPGWMRGFRTGFDDVGRACSGMAVGFAPRLALMELEERGVMKASDTTPSQPQQQARTAYDELCAITVKAFRAFAAHRGLAPSAKTTDKEIIDIYQLIGSKFREVAKERNEEIPGVYLTTIVFKFYQFYEQPQLRPHFDSHLRYELDSYRTRGLRDDYKVDLGIF